MRTGNSTAINVVSLLGVAGALAYCGSSSDNSVFPSGTTGGISTGQGSSGTGIATGSGTGIIGTTGGTSTGTGIGTGSGTGGITSDAACAAQASDSTALPSDIFIMLDKSGSMNCPASDDMCETPPRMVTHPTRWEAVTMAINGFVAAPASSGIGVGIGFFSAAGRAACDVNAYAMPTVPIAALPGSAMPITSAIAANMPSTNTPTVPALTGAIQYAKQYTMSTPGRAASVVFVTDGIPNGCNSTIPAAAMAAMAGYTGMPQVKTYVIGLGATASLDQIALAGTGGATHYFPATGDVAGQLAAALTKISGQVSCDYTIPMAAVDPKNVNVQVSLGGGAKQGLPYVGAAAMCTSGGWFYDDPAKPTKITLCPQTCDPLKATMNSSVQVLYGCPTVGPGVQ